VIGQKLAVSAGAYYSPDNLGPGRFVVYASPVPGVDMEIIETAVEKTINQLLADGVTADEVARSINTMQAGAIYARDSLSGGARTLGAALASGQTTDDVEAWPDRISAVTPVDVNASARHVFVKAQSVTALLLPKEQ
ncbi:MAG: insulinase family protein, partial [Rhodospirillales bacterium]|nr:insulinase family protein [Rhodospirillales bacterium]